MSTIANESSQSDEPSHEMSSFEVHLNDWVGPDHVDENQILRPGKILEWMDEVGSLVATRYNRAPAVTASLDGFTLRHPIKLGARVSISGRVCFTSPRSLGIAVSLDHWNPDKEHTEKNTVEGYLVFVAMSPEGIPMPITPYRPQSKVDQVLYEHGKLRHDFRQRLKNKAHMAQSQKKDPRIESLSIISDFIRDMPKSMLKPMQIRNPLKYRPQYDSYIHKVEPVFQRHLNFHGTLYGGILMNWVERACCMSAQAHIFGESCAMESVHGLNFLESIAKHVFVHIKARVVHTNRSSMTVFVQVESEDPIKGRLRKCMEAFLTYRPLKKCLVPQVNIGTDEEKSIFGEVEMRLGMHQDLWVDQAVC